jgi:hypothetical protein
MGHVMNTKKRRNGTGAGNAGKIGRAGLRFQWLSGSSRPDPTGSVDFPLITQSERKAAPTGRRREAREGDNGTDYEQRKVIGR